MADLTALLTAAVERRGSDLHVKVGSAPVVRVDGRLVPLDVAPLTQSQVEAVIEGMAPAAKAAEIAETGEADFALSIAGLGRFRVNVHRQRGSTGFVVRRVLPGTPSFERLGLPPAVRAFADQPDGLILVTGSAGCGKTTTAAALIDHINTTRACSLLTIEDPVEVLHPDKAAFVVQREVGSDTHDFAAALARAWRQDPDVVFVSDVREPMVVQSCLELAETGHLVIACLPTLGVEETIERVLDFFSPSKQRAVLTTLARVLRGIVSQRLLDRADGRGRVPCVEVLVGTPRIADRLAGGGQPVQLLDLVDASELAGMQTFDQSLEQLCRAGLVTVVDALAAAGDPPELKIRLQQAGVLTGS